MSTPFVIFSTKSGSLISPGIIYIHCFTWLGRSWSHPILLKVLYKTKAFTLAPELTNASHKWEPIKPSAPVTKTFVFLKINYSFNRKYWKKPQKT